MKKTISLSLMAVASLYATEVELAPVGVESTVVTEVSQNAQTSADLAQALSSSVPSIDMNRRSAIANDIYIRGQKRDNISVEVDGTKVCGACPNRMDPPVSHILASQIDEVEVIEGPYDVETFGTMSGGIKIKTKQPKKELSGSVDFGYGSWNYLKTGATVSGGNDVVRVLISGSKESSDQYKDGNGDTIAEQVDKYATGTGVAGTRYKTTDKDMKAYEKKSLMSKMYINVTDDQELGLSYTMNRSDDVMYGNSKMDADYDDSNIFSATYDIKNIGDILKDVNLQYYHSDVDHPMSTRHRMSSANPRMRNTNHLKTKMEGLKLKTKMDISDTKITLGLDASQRNWDGKYYKTDTLLPLPTGNSKSIDDSQTDNRAIFLQVKKRFSALQFSFGARYDSTTITHATYADRDFSGFNANLVTTYNFNEENKIFLGIGQAYRVPDARELYFRSSMGGWVGTSTLDQTKNQEVDLGYESDNDSFKLKIKAFYSKLSDYIYYQKGLRSNNFKNIDATLYGAELSSSVYVGDDMSIDMGLSYKKGQKDHALAGQSDTDLADIAPFRGSLALNYEYMQNSTATLEMQASDRWNDIDADNGEQELAGWGVLNFKVKHSFNKNFNFTFGINNILDKTYAINNTYADLTLITAGGTSDIMLMNEPGRYVYTNLNFKF
jgi:iron complex outermembrane receptor protein